MKDDNCIGNREERFRNFVIKDFVSPDPAQQLVSEQVYGYCDTETVCDEKGIATDTVNVFAMLG